MIYTRVSYNSLARVLTPDVSKSFRRSRLVVQNGVWMSVCRFLAKMFRQSERFEMKRYNPRILQRQMTVQTVDLQKQWLLLQFEQQVYDLIQSIDMHLPEVSVVILLLHPYYIHQHLSEWNHLSVRPLIIWLLLLLNSLPEKLCFKVHLNCICRRLRCCQCILHPISHLLV